MALFSLGNLANLLKPRPEDIIKKNLSLRGGGNLPLPSSVSPNLLTAGQLANAQRALNPYGFPIQFYSPTTPQGPTVTPPLIKPQSATQAVQGGTVVSMLQGLPLQPFRGGTPAVVPPPTPTGGITGGPTQPTGAFSGLDTGLSPGSSQFPLFAGASGGVITDPNEAKRILLGFAAQSGRWPTQNPATGEIDPRIARAVQELGIGLGDVPPVPSNLAPAVAGQPAPAGTTGPAGTVGQPVNALQDYFNQIASLTSEQRQMLGLEETAEMKKDREAKTATLNRLLELAEQAAKAGAPQEQLIALDDEIRLQQKALADLTPAKFLESQPGLKDVGITQPFLERRVAQEKEPIAAALTDLLMSRSIAGQKQAIETQRLQNQISAQQNILQVQEALSKLAPTRTGMQDILLRQLAERAFAKPEKAPTSTDITEYEYAKTTGAIPATETFAEYQKRQANLRAAAIPLSQNLDRVLSVEEAKSFNAPFGTKASEVVGKVPTTTISQETLKQRFRVWISDDTKVPKGFYTRKELENMATADGVDIADKEIQELIRKKGAANPFTRFVKNLF